MISEATIEDVGSATRKREDQFLCDVFDRGTTVIQRQDQEIADLKRRLNEKCSDLDRLHQVIGGFEEVVNKCTSKLNPSDATEIRDLVRYLRSRMPFKKTIEVLAKGQSDESN